MKKFYLEFLRGAAALIVLTYHFFELHTLSIHSNHFYFAKWGTDAVMIFFILSGIVINMSQTNNPKTRGAFLSNRLIRLYPQLAIGLLLGITVLIITGAQLPSAGVIIGNFSMLSLEHGYMPDVVPCIASNSPIWSLSFEIIFYLIFCISIGKHQKKILFGWFILSLTLLPFYYLNLGNNIVKQFLFVMTFSSVWLIGYYIFEFRNYFYADKFTALFSLGALPLISRMHIAPIYYDPAKYLLFAIFAIPFFSYCLQGQKNGRKISIAYLIVPYAVIMLIVFRQPYITFANFVVYSSFPVLLTGAALMIRLFKLEALVIGHIKSKGSILGKYSYSFYISHYPVFFLFTTFFHSIILCLVISLPFIIVIAYSLENYLQPAMVIFFHRTRIGYALRASAAIVKRSWQPGRRFATIKKLALPLTNAIAWILMLPFNNH